MLQRNIVRRTVTVAKEMTLDAVSLLAEAVLGKPVSARAGCPSWPFCGYAYDSCLSCGADKKKRYWCFCYGVSICCQYVDCVSC
jgi:hypothetical protein